jgi:bifunctional DNA primase/polymerase-like protein
MPVNSSCIDQTDIDQLRPTALLAALAFARHDHAVLPLTWPVKVNGRMVCSCRKAADCISPAKHPFGRLVPRGLLDASTDEVVVRKWFTDETQANLGVRTDRLVVIDVDPRHDGDSSLAALEHDHDFPTWRVITGGGGQHVIFRCPEGVTVNSSNAQSNPLLGAGIDIRAKGGYIVAPPSRHISGHSYCWSVDHHPDDVPIAEAPSWLVEALTADKRSSSTGGRRNAAWALDQAGFVYEYRDMAVCAVAGKLLRAISLDPAFVSVLVHDWNARHCRPPLSERAVAEILDRIANREIARLENVNA